MGKVLGVSPLYSIQPHGKIGDPAGQSENPWYGIYQRRHCQEGIISCRLNFYTPTNPQTVPQQANRSKFSSGVSAWQALSAEQRKLYNDNAVGLHMSGYNLFLRIYMYG